MLDQINGPDNSIQSQVKVLVVDDIAANLFSLEQILKKTKVQVFKASSGAQALELIAVHDFACCLLDIHMPIMNGFQLAQNIRLMKGKSELPIIFVTAENSDPKSILQGYDFGAVDYLVKPLEPIIVQSKVKVFAHLFMQKMALDRSREIQELNSKLTQANADLEHFTYITSHDLREPLRLQGNMLDILEIKLSIKDNPQAKQLFDKIRNSTRSMIQMINAFRELTQLSSSMGHRIDVDLKYLINNCLEDFSEQLQKRQVQVKIDSFPATMPAYPGLLRSLYHNMIHNALEHSQGKAMLLHFTYEPKENGAILGVYNTQSSIPISELQNIFKLFRQFHNNHEGRGVGLCICKKVIDRHNGRIWAESGDNYAHFKFTLGEINGSKL